MNIYLFLNKYHQKPLKTTFVHKPYKKKTIAKKYKSIKIK